MTSTAILLATALLCSFWVICLSWVLCELPRSMFETMAKLVSTMFVAALLIGTFSVGSLFALLNGAEEDPTPQAAFSRVFVACIPLIVAVVCLGMAFRLSRRAPRKAVGSPDEGEDCAERLEIARLLFVASSIGTCYAVWFLSGWLR